MYMRKTAKALCLALSLIMLVNLAGFEVSATDTAQGKADVSDKVQTGETAADEDTVSDSEQETDDSDDEQDVPSDNETDVPKGDMPEDDQSNKDHADTDTSEPSEPVTEPDSEPAKDDTEQTQEEEAPVSEKATSDPQEIKGLIAERVAGSNTQLKLSWDAVADAAEYQVRLLKYSGGAEVKKIENITDLNCTVDVTPGEKYYIEVSAFKSGDSDPIVTETIPAVLLASPSVTTAVSATAVKLSWKAVAGAGKYQVTYGNKKQDVTGTSFTAQNLAKGTKYSFTVQTVCTFNEANNKTYTYESDAVTVSATTKMDKPDKVKKLTGMDGDKSVILTWSKAARAQTYVIYRYNASKKKWEVVKKNVKTLTYTDNKLKQGTTYKYRVAASNSGGVGAVSPTVSVKVKKTPGKVRTIGYKAVVKSRAPLFTAAKSKKKVRYLKKGTKVTTIDYANKRYAIKLSDGKTYWLSKDRLTFTASIWTTKDYSTKTKEDFVNNKGYKSKTKHLIWVNQYTQRIVIYKGSKGKWKVVRSASCATGKHGSMTPKGTLYITYRKKGRYYRTCYESPIVYFTTGNAFHSRIKWYSGGYKDATIGRPKSHGCVRLLQPEIDYIYKYCGKGTTIISY